MDDESHAGIVDELPHAVEGGVERRELAGAGGDRGRAHHQHLRSQTEDPAHLGRGGGGVAQRDVGRAEDAVLAVVAPVLVQPLVEAPHHGRHRIDVVAQQFLVEHPQSGEEPHGLKALGVHDLETGLRVHVMIGQRLPVAQHLGRVAALGVPLEVVAQRPGLGDRVPRRVGHRPGQLAPDEMVLAAAHVHPLHHPGLHAGIDVAGECVEGLVVMVVGIERSISEVLRRQCRGIAGVGR